jgi:tRNA modification GTPase
MKIWPNDTIAAIATPPGEGAIAVIRVSGPDCFAIVDKVFRGNTRIVNAGGYTVHYGKLVDAEGNLIDYVLATVFREPHSYSGENSVEISCHGGLMLTRLVLGSILQAGARQADPGEFTKRAFLGGKIDLSQAEAVADLIAARSHKAHLISLSQLTGKLSEVLRPLKNDLVETYSLLELELDFSEEGIPLMSRDRLANLIRQAASRVEDLIRSYETGRVFREGASVVLIGEPNAGKSSLFNRLLLEERAIVSARPGTTRDFIEEQMVVDDIPLRIADTAGIRETNDFVELLGAKKTEELVSKSDLVVEIVDVTMVKEVLYVGRASGNGKKVILALNKVDLLDSSIRSKIEKLMMNVACKCVFVSALTGEGIHKLEEAIVVSLLGDLPSSSQESITVTSQRQMMALRESKQSLERALESARAGISNEFVSVDLRNATDALSEILGEITSDDILNHIFGKFCIGK